MKIEIGTKVRSESKDGNNYLNLIAIKKYIDPDDHYAKKWVCVDPNSDENGKCIFYGFKKKYLKIGWRTDKQ